MHYTYTVTAVEWACCHQRGCIPEKVDDTETPPTHVLLDQDRYRVRRGFADRRAPQGMGAPAWGGRFLGHQPAARQQRASRRASHGPLLALFSPVASRPRVGERKDMLLWNAWVDASGQVRPLPPHTFIASRSTLPSGRRREQHYALVCASSTALTVGTQLRVFPDHLRSVSTGQPLGAAQGRPWSIASGVRRSRRARAIRSRCRSARSTVFRAARAALRAEGARSRGSEQGHARGRFRSLRRLRRAFARPFADGCRARRHA